MLDTFIIRQTNIIVKEIQQKLIFQFIIYLFKIEIFDTIKCQTKKKYQKNIEWILTSKLYCKYYQHRKLYSL